MPRRYDTVVITGGSEGIGLALAGAFAPRCRRLVLLARGAERLERAAASLRARWPDAGIVSAVCDVTDRAAVREAFARIEAIDLLINNAGVSLFGPADRTPLEEARRVMEVDYFGAVHCTLAALPGMRARNAGAIVTVASVAGLRGIPYLSAYGAAKAALAAFSQGLRAELCDTGIRVLLVYPDYTQTGLFAKEPVYGEAHRPAGPYAPADRVAGAILRAVDRGRTEVVLSARGRLLAAARGLCPRLLDRGMAAYARRLRGARP